MTALWRHNPPNSKKFQRGQLNSKRKIIIIIIVIKERGRERERERKLFKLCEEWGSGGGSGGGGGGGGVRGWGVGGWFSNTLEGTLYLFLFSLCVFCLKYWKYCNAGGWCGDNSRMTWGRRGFSGLLSLKLCRFMSYVQFRICFLKCSVCLFLFLFAYRH